MNPETEQPLVEYRPPTVILGDGQTPCGVFDGPDGMGLLFRAYGLPAEPFRGYVETEFQPGDICIRFTSMDGVAFLARQLVIVAERWKLHEHWEGYGFGRHD